MRLPGKARLTGRHRVHHAEGHARRVSAGESGRAGSEIGGSEGTAEESSQGSRDGRNGLLPVG
jgi:hypothetical protein